MFRIRGRITALAYGLLALLSAAEADAKIEPPPLAGLAQGSDVIVVARVDSVTGRPKSPGRRAKATVMEVWKGPKAETVQFLASPTWMCDISDAKVGEEVLLFLSKDRRDGWIISGAGRGRMPLLILDGKTYACPFIDVMLPPGTPSITTGVGQDRGFDRAVELDTARDLVKRAVQDKNKK